MKKLLMSVASLLLVLPLGIVPISASETESGEKEIIEANPGDGVKKYSNRITGYWRNCSSGGIYGVRGASSANYSTATNYAYNRIGRGYGFDPIADDFYCSELVYYAWDAAGYDIDYNRVWGTPILPSHLMLDGDTYLKESF